MQGIRGPRANTQYTRSCDQSDAISARASPRDRWAWQGYEPAGSTCAVVWISLHGDDRLQTLRYVNFYDF